MLETSARLLRLLSLLQSRRDWTGPELAERLDVTTRTVRHDVDRLRQLGYLVTATLGVAGGYRLGSGATLPPLLLDDDEAVAIALGLRTAANGPITGIDEATVRALAKLEQLLPAQLRRKVSALRAYIVPAAAFGPTVDSDTLTALAVACRNQEQIRIRYRRHDDTASTRDVEPHRLVSTARRWYLLAWDTDRHAWRTFRVDRVRLADNQSGRRFAPRPLPGNDPAAYILTGIEQSAWPYHASVTAHIDAETLAHRLPHYFLIEPIDERTCRVQLGSDTPLALAAWLGVLDTPFEVDNPQAHPELIEHLRQLAERYLHAAQPGPGQQP